MNKQQVAAVARQAGAILVSIYGVLTANGTLGHLPVAVSAVLTAAAPVMYVVEHYVGDPSTGKTVAPAVKAPAPVAHQVAPAPVDPKDAEIARLQAALGEQGKGVPAAGN